MYATVSPFSKTALDINKLYVTSPITSKIPDEGEDKKDKAEESSVCKGWSKQSLRHSSVIIILKKSLSL